MLKLPHVAQKKTPPETMQWIGSTHTTADGAASPTASVRPYQTALDLRSFQELGNNNAIVILPLKWMYNIYNIDPNSALAILKNRCIFQITLSIHGS